MTTHENEFGQPLGAPLPGWSPPPHPPHELLEGRWCRLEPLDPERHAAELFEANAEDDGRMWTYLPYGPFETLEAYRDWLIGKGSGTDPLFYAIRDLETGRLGGLTSYLRIKPEVGSIEVGHLAYAPRLQRTRAGTEANHLLMRRAFELGYRRYEWKCDALNAASMRAAERYGFRYEGTFRSSVVYKGRNRDTAWFAITDDEWPALDARFRAWLAPENFDERGLQRSPLRAEAPRP